MVSNEDIREKLKGKRNGINTHDIIQESHETTSDDFNIICTRCGAENPSISNFCSECGKPIEVKPGYVVCDVCYGIYELEEGESLEDFINCQCQCGGNLAYIQDMDELEDLTKNCPVCGHINPYHIKRCEKCGRCFDVGIEYFESLLIDVEITHNTLRIYHKENSKLTDVNQYNLNKITNFSVVKESSGYKINFNYQKHDLTFKISSEQAFNLKKLDFVSQEMIGCTNPNCMHIGLLKEDGNCPDCGLKSKKVEMKSYNKMMSLKRGQRIESTKKKEKARIEKEKNERKARYGPKFKGVKDVFEGKHGRVMLLDDKIVLNNSNPLIVGFGYNHILFDDIISIKTVRHKDSRTFIVNYRKKKGTMVEDGSQITVFKEKKVALNFKESQASHMRKLKSILEEKIKENQTIKVDAESKKINPRLADLEKLAELRDKGIITEEEFQAKKKQILGL